MKRLALILALLLPQFLKSAALPDAPTGVTATGISFQKSMRVAWNTANPSTVTAYPIGAYRLTVSGLSPAYDRRFSASTLAVTVTGIPCGTSMVATVYSIDISDASSAASLTAVASVPCPPVFPPLITGAVNDQGAIVGAMASATAVQGIGSIYFTFANVSGMANPMPLTNNSDASGFTQLTLTGNQSYWIRSCAVDLLGVSACSAVDLAVLPPPILSQARGLRDSVYLSWSSVSSSALAPSVTGYAVYYDTVTPTIASSVSVVADTAGTVGVTLTSALLSPDTTYYFSVATRGGLPGPGFEGALSQPVIARTSHPSPKISIFSQSLGGSLQLSGTALVAADLGSDTLTGYYLWKSASQNLAGASLMGSSSTGAVFCVTPAAAPSTEYYFIVASGTAGASAVPPALLSGTQIDTLAPPSATALTANSRVLLNWSAVNNATDYQIYRNTNPALVTSTPLVVAAGTSYLDVSPVSGAGNIYLVTARRSYTLLGIAFAGLVESAADAYVTATPLVMPGMPGRYFDKSLGTDAFLLTATAVPDAVTGLANVYLSWAKSLSGSAELTGYQLYRGAGLNSLAQLAYFASTTLAAYSYVDLSVDASLTYLYGVTAMDVSGNASAMLTQTAAPYVYPHAPAFLSATVGASNLVNLIWPAAVSGTSSPTTAYAIYRSATSTSTGLFQLTVSASVLAYSDLASPITSSALLYSVFTIDKNNIYSQLPVSRSLVNPNGVSLAASAVTGVVVKSVSGISAAVLVSWNQNPGPEAVSYTVFDNAVPIATGLTSTSFGYATFLTYGANLDLSVAAINYSSSLTGIAGFPSPSHLPPTPLNLRALAQADTSGTQTAGIQLNWSDMGIDPSYMTGYEVYRDGSYLSSVALNSYRDTAVAAPNSYAYSVRSIGNGVESPSATAAAFQALTLTAAPAAVNATALTTGASVLLTWTPVPGAAKYWIFRSTNSNADYPTAAFAITKTLSGGSSSFIDTGVQSGTPFYYAVAGANYMGLGAGLATGQVIPFPGPVSSLTVTYPGPASVHLAWTPPSLPADADQYVVERATSPAFSPSVLSATVSNSLTDTSVVSGNRYYYRVATLKTGLGSVSSTAVSAFPVDFPLALSEVALIGLPGGKASLSWAPAESKYGISNYSISFCITDTASVAYCNSISLSSLATSSLLALTYTSTSLPLSFSATVSAINVLGTGPASAPLLTLSNAALGLPPPSNFTAVTGFVETQANFARVRLDWTPVPGSFSYAIYGATYSFAVTSTTGGPANPLYLTTVGAVSTFPMAPVSTNAPYFFAITTYNPSAGYAGGESYPVLCQPQGVTPYSYPSYVSITAALAGSNRFDIAWNAPLLSGTAGSLDAAPYRLYRFSQGSGGLVAFGPNPDAGFPVSFSAATTTYSDLGVLNGGAYTYYISVVDSLGREQYPPYLAAYDIKPQGPRQPPQQLQFIAGDGTVTIRWLIPVAEGNLNIKYNVYRRLSGTAYAGPLGQLTAVGPAKTQFVNVTQLVQSLNDDTAQNRTTYAYAMSAINSYGEGQKSDEFFVTPFKPVKASNPYLRAEVTGKKNVLLQWGAAQSQNGFGGYDVNNYVVLRSGNSGGKLDVLGSVTDTGVATLSYSFLDTGTAFGGNYVYTIYPVDIKGNTGVSYQLATINIPGPVNNILVFKNSFNPDRGETVPIQYSLIVSGHAWVRIYTVQGEYVATLFEEDVDSSTSADNPYLSEKKNWDGKNASGQTVASGVYIIHVDAPGFSSNARVAVIK